MPPIDYHRLADSLLAALVVLAIFVLTSTLIASCAYRKTDTHWLDRDVPTKEVGP
jgi:hypothetical protein